jgi:uncharacterized protein
MNPRFIVIDTNILISAALSPTGTANRAFTRAIQRFTLVQSNATYQEIESRIYKQKFDKYISTQSRKEFIDAIKDNSQFVQTTSQIIICRDLDDNKFLELAIDSNAEFLMTGDNDLLSLKSQADYQSQRFFRTRLSYLTNTA